MHHRQHAHPPIHRRESQSTSSSLPDQAARVSVGVDREHLVRVKQVLDKLGGLLGSPQHSEKTAHGHDEAETTGETD